MQKSGVETCGKHALRLCKGLTFFMHKQQMTWPIFFPLARILVYSIYQPRLVRKTRTTQSTLAKLRPTRKQTKF